MYSWLYRKKKQALGVAAATVAACVTAYVVYSWYTSTEVAGDSGESGAQERVDGTREGKACGTEGGVVTPPVTSSAKELQSQLEEHLEALKATTATQAAPEVLQLLKGRVAELAGLAEIAAQLQLIRDGAAPARNKVALWQELRDRSFLHLVAATWLEPLVASCTAVMVIVLGRHMYLEVLARSESTSSIAGAGPGSGSLLKAGARVTAAPHLWPLSVAQQAAFMSFVPFIVKEGMLEVMPRMLAEVERVLARRKLQELLSSGEVAHLLSDIHSGLAGALPGGSGGWADVLLPPVMASSCASDTAGDGDAAGGAVVRGQAKKPSSSALAAPCCSLPAPFQPEGLCDVDAGVVAELVLEARHAVSSPGFHEAVLAGVKLKAKRLQAELDAEFEQMLVPNGSAGRPRSAAMARVVPMVSRVAEHAITAEDEDVHELLLRPDMHRFLLQIYASGASGGVHAT